jgi:hypothetical protein
VALNSVNEIQIDALMIFEACVAGLRREGVPLCCTILGRSRQSYRELSTAFGEAFARSLRTANTRLKSGSTFGIGPRLRLNCGKFSNGIQAQMSVLF